jgi:hypothetical protein
MYTLESSTIYVIMWMDMSPCLAWSEITSFMRYDMIYLVVSRYIAEFLWLRSLFRFTLPYY